MSDERGDAVVLTSDHVRNGDNLRSNLREMLGRQLVDAPEFGRVFGIPPDKCKVWIWGVSAIDRLLIDRYAGGGPKEAKHDPLKWLEAYAAAALRDGDTVDAKPLFLVPGPDNGKLLEMGHATLNRIVLESQVQDYGEGFGQRVLAELEDFGEAEETPSFNTPTSSASE